MNVLAGLAEGVLDAILEHEDDPRRDPFAMALERYRSHGVPPEARSPWRTLASARPAGRDPTAVLRKLDRDLLAGVVGYATGAPTPLAAETGETEATSPTLAVIGAGGPMPSLELGPDGTWHVAASPATPEARQAGDAVRATVPTLASRYPTPRVGLDIRVPHRPTEPDRS